MTKDEFLFQLTTALRTLNVPDAEDIAGEYEQHFAFKLADGFSEAEVAAKLGAPEVLAKQFVSGPEVRKGGGRKVVTAIGLVFLDILAALFFALLWAWEVVMAALSVASAALAICLIGAFNAGSLVPWMPYGCGLTFGVSAASLAVLAATGSVYFAAFVSQFMRAYGRFHHNAMAAASGKAVLPSLAIYPRFAAKVNRRIRIVALLSLTIFAVSFIAAVFLCMLSAGSLGFWHAWNWFVQ